jgi:hypothetical protein
MKSLPFSLTANVAGVFSMSSKLTAGDHNERDFSVSEAASATRAVQEFMAAVARDVSSQGHTPGATFARIRFFHRL